MKIFKSLIMLIFILVSMSPNYAEENHIFEEVDCNFQELKSENDNKYEYFYGHIIKRLDDYTILVKEGKDENGKIIKIKLKEPYEDEFIGLYILNNEEVCIEREI